MKKSLWRRARIDPASWKKRSSCLLVVAGLLSLAAAQPAVGLAQQAPQRAPGDVFKDCDDCPEMVVVPPGEFLMGWDGGEDARYEGPVHEVEIRRAFAVGRFELTYAQYAAFIEATNHPSGRNCRTWGGDSVEDRLGKDWRDPAYGRPMRPDEPVSCVNWNDAKAYAAWLAEDTGEPYRLLTEAEWEYAARAGRPHTLYSWGDTPDGACRYANLYDLSGATSSIPRPYEPANCDDGAVDLAVVGSREPNPFGLYDMIGNVWEWIEDCYVMTFLEDQTDDAAQTTYGCDRRGVRGGSWSSIETRQRPTFRGRDPVGLTTQIFGFRVARDLP